MPATRRGRGSAMMPPTGELRAIVIRFVVSGPLPRLPALRARCIADPDALVEIARRLERPDSGKLDEADRFSLILHDLRMGGAWKRTNRGRLRRTEEMLCAYIDPGLRPAMILLDLGASDGITTVEALRALRRAFGDDVRALLADAQFVRCCAIAAARSSNTAPPTASRSWRASAALACASPAPRQARPAHGDPLARLYLRLGRLRGSMRRDARDFVGASARPQPSPASAS